MKHYKIIHSNFPLAISLRVTRRERLMTAIYSMLDDATSPEAMKLHADAVEASRARRQREEDELSAGESTV